MFPRNIVCLRNVNTQHKGGDDDDDDDDNNKNNYYYNYNISDTNRPKIMEINLSDVKSKSKTLISNNNQAN